jgi:hypothetical protein
MIARTTRAPVLTPPAPRPRWQTASIVPLHRPAWLLDEDEIVAIEVHALVYDLVEESTRFLATFPGSVAVVSEFSGADVVFNEGDALKIRTLRQRHRIAEEQRQQCGDAIEDLLR